MLLYDSYDDSPLALSPRPHRLTACTPGGRAQERCQVKRLLREARHGTPHPEDPGFELLYVGTAPQDGTSKGDLRKRLDNHHRAAIGSSTFRLDLTAFLWQIEGWRPGWTDRPKLPDDDIAALAKWQRKYLHVQ